MVSVLLTELFVHRADDHPDCITFDGGTESSSTNRAGEIRTMANGRRRAVFGTALDKQLSYTCPFVAREKYETLEGWVDDGVELMVRDVKGRVVFGHVFSLDADETTTEYVNLSFTVQPVTHSIEV